LTSHIYFSFSLPIGDANHRFTSTSQHMVLQVSMLSSLLQAIIYLVFF